MSSRFYKLRAVVVGFAAIVVGLAMAVSGAADDWKFADAAHNSARYKNTRYKNTRGTVIRGQYSTSDGRSVPTLYPTQPPYNQQGYTTAQPAPRYAMQPGGTVTTPPAGQTGPVYSPPAPVYGQGPGFPPPLTGDAAGQGPYVTDTTESSPTPLFGVEPDPRGAMPHIGLGIPVQETQTGRFMVGVGVNSEAGLVGSIVVDEQNFDWRRFPRSFEDIRNATAWRGAGQRFRLEAVPGTQVQRYMASFTEPYLLNTDISLSASAFYFTRIYEYWDEQRLGGRLALGYHFSHALTGSLAYRGASINISDPYTPTPAELARVIGDSVLHGLQAKLAHDTRDSAFLATEGHLIETSFEQVVGTYVYPRFNIDVRKYFHFSERADQSGRHVVSLNARMGISGSDTPIYDNFYAGGFSTIRGFYFRGASPRDPATGVIVGGHFMLLASIEYLFPITADDMLRGVVFCDSGTVEPSIDDWDDRYRVAPGFGLRIVVPAMGPAPIALDFAFPVSINPGDREQVFSFFVGFAR